KYILENLDQIIEKKIERYTRSLPEDSDSGGNSSDSDDDGNNRYQYIKYKGFIGRFDNICNKMELKF
ncbi:hypothetical protein RhiirC2_762930, partial [Rhizophagus irregularis]